MLSKPQVRLLGNVEYGVDVKLDDLREHYDAVVFTTGAEKDRDLDVPGIDLPGSFGGADFVSWFDGHPDVPRTWPLEARQIAVVGAGNVGLDVARMLSKTADELLVTEIPDNVYEGLKASPVEEVHVFARRGPAQAKFTPLELRELDHSPNVEVIVAPEDIEYDDGSVAAINKDNQTKLVVRELERYAMRTADQGLGTRPRKLFLHFFESPVEVLGDGKVEAFRTERTELTGDGNVRGTGADPRLAGAGGLPLRRLPQHRAGRPALGQPQPRGAPRGRPRARPRRRPHGRPLRQRLGQARSRRPDRPHEGRRHRDGGQPARRPRGRHAARAPPTPEPEAVLELLEQRGLHYTTWEGWDLLDAHEISLGEPHGRPRIKVVDRETMVEVSRAVAQAKADGDEQAEVEALERLDGAAVEQSADAAQEQVAVNERTAAS